MIRSNQHGLSGLTLEKTHSKPQNQSSLPWYQYLCGAQYSYPNIQLPAQSSKQAKLNLSKALREKKSRAVQSQVISRRTNTQFRSDFVEMSQPIPKKNQKFVLISQGEISQPPEMRQVISSEYRNQGQLQSYRNDGRKLASDGFQKNQKSGPNGLQRSGWPSGLINKCSNTETTTAPSFQIDPFRSPKHPTASQSALFMRPFLKANQGCTVSNTISVGEKSGKVSSHMHGHSKTAATTSDPLIEACFSSSIRVKPKFNKETHFNQKDQRQFCEFGEQERGKLCWNHSQAHYNMRISQNQRFTIFPNQMKRQHTTILINPEEKSAGFYLSNPQKMPTHWKDKETEYKQLNLKDCQVQTKKADEAHGNFRKTDDWQLQYAQKQRDQSSNELRSEVNKEKDINRENLDQSEYKHLSLRKAKSSKFHFKGGKAKSSTKIEARSSFKHSSMKYINGESSESLCSHGSPTKFSRNKCSQKESTSSQQLEQSQKYEKFSHFGKKVKIGIRKVESFAESSEEEFSELCSIGDEYRFLMPEICEADQLARSKVTSFANFQPEEEQRNEGV